MALLKSLSCFGYVKGLNQRCADMYLRIDILRLSIIFTDMDRIRRVISLFERIWVWIRILCHRYSADIHNITSVFYFMFYFDKSVVTGES